MKLTKYERFLLFEIVVVLIANLSFFGLPIISDAMISIANYHRKKLVCGLIVFLFLQFIVFERKLKFVFYTNIYHKLVYYYLIVIITISGISCIVYSQNFSELFNTYYYLLSILLFFVLSFHFRQSNNFYDHFLNLFINIGVIYSVYIILAKVLYGFGITIFSTQIYYIQTRASSLRLASPSDYLGIAAVICFAFIIKNRMTFTAETKRLNYVKLFVIIFAVFFVTQTRMYEITIIISCLLMYLFSTKLTIKKLLIVLLISIFILLFWDTFDRFFTTFSSSSTNKEYVWSTLLRMEGIDYYLSHMFDHKIMGIGFVVNRSYSFILYGENGNLAISDVGYFGFLGVYGIMGLLFLLFWFYNNTKTTIKIIKKNIAEQYAECIGLFAFIAFSFISVIFSDSQRTAYLPIYLAIFDYVYYRSYGKN